MVLNKDFMMGFVSGTVVGAVGYRLYEQNQGQLSQLIQNPGIPSMNSLPSLSTNQNEVTMEDLIAQKNVWKIILLRKK